MTAAQAGDLGGVVREERRPRDRAERKRPLGPSKPRRVPWPPASRTAATRPCASASSPASRARRSRAWSASVRGSGMTSAGPAARPGRARRSPSPTSSPTSRPTRSRSSASICSRRCSRSCPSRRSRAAARWPWRALRQPLLEVVPGWRATLTTPSTRFAIYLVPRRPLVQRQRVRAWARGRSRRVPRAPGAPGSSARRARGRW